MAFGNVFGGILGSLAGGTIITGTTAATTNWYGPDPFAQTNYYGQGISTAAWQTQINTQTAQWLGNIQGTATIGTTNFAQAFFDIPLQSANVWVPQLTPEQIKAFEVAEEQHRIEREAAKGRATELLQSQLDPAQLEQFERDGHFDVKIKDRTYRIRPGSKVLALHEPKDRRALCILPGYGYGLPNEDVALAQKLTLEADEEKFLKTAIRWAA